MRLVATFFVLIFVIPVSAIVVQDYTAAEAVPSDSGFDLNWDYVYNYKGSSAVAVGGGWLLTAGHVADDGGDGSLTINGSTYTQQEIVYHPDADLARVRYDKAFPGYYSLYTTEAPTQDLPGLEVLMVGFGNTGTVSTDYYQDSGTGKGTKRWGSQIIDRTSTKRYDSNGPVVGYTQNSGFLMDFVMGDTNSSHEAGGGVGDSGGGVFYKTNGIWQLAGIMTSRSGGPQYGGTFAVATTAYADWITASIPEPAAIGLLGFGTIGLFLARSRYQRRRTGSSIFPVKGGEALCDRFDAGEEGKAVGEERVYADYLLARLKRLSASPPAVWMTAVQVRYREFNKAAWGLLMVLLEKAASRNAIGQDRFKIAVIRSTDSFLERISWDRMAASVTSARRKSNQALKMSARRGLDTFLEIIAWDRMEAAFKRLKKTMRFRRRLR